MKQVKTKFYKIQLKLNSMQ